MNNDDNITIFGLIVFLVLIFLSFKMLYEILIKNYDKEIKRHYYKKNEKAIIIRKPSRTEKKSNPFNKNVYKLRPFFIGPRTTYKYRLIETSEDNRINRTEWIQIKIRFILKPKIEFR